MGIITDRPAPVAAKPGMLHSGEGATSAESSPAAATRHRSQAEHSMKTGHGRPAHALLDLYALRVHGDVHRRGERTEDKERGCQADRVESHAHEIHCGTECQATHNTDTLATEAADQ